jgi:hypothetical protein
MEKRKKVVKKAESKIMKAIVRRLTRKNLFDQQVNLITPKSTYADARKQLDRQRETFAVQKMLADKFRKMLENTDLPYVTSPDTEEEHDADRDIRIGNEVEGEKEARSWERDQHESYVQERLNAQDATILSRLANSQTLVEPDRLLDLDHQSIATFLRQYRAYQFANGRKHMNEFVNPSLYAPLQIRTKFEDLYYKNIRTIPNKELTEYLKMYSHAADVTEASLRLSRIKCIVDALDYISPVELSNYYTRFQIEKENVGPNKPSERVMRDIWLRNLQPPYFQRLVRDN